MQDRAHGARRLAAHLHEVVVRVGRKAPDRTALGLRGVAARSRQRRAARQQAPAPQKPTAEVGWIMPPVYKQKRRPEWPPFPSRV
jgi:hypothetical protein